jgi:sensor domain CHASE-containing protein
MDGIRSQLLKNERWQQIVLAASFISIALGLFVLIGWHARMTAFVQMHPRLAPTPYITAWCFLLSGTALYAFAGRKLRFTFAVGWIVSTIAWLTVMEYLFAVNLGLDHFFFFRHFISSLPPPERMSPISALCFLQIGHALILAGCRTTTRSRPPVLGLLGAVVAAWGATALSGYAAGLDETFIPGQLSRIALPEAAVLVILGLGIFVIGWNEGRRPGEHLPRWLPLPLALAIFAISLMLWQTLDSRQTRRIAQTIKGNTTETRNRIIALMEARIEILVRLAQRWEHSAGTPRPAWEADARDIAADFPGFQAIEWVDPSYHVRWIVPQKGNERILNLDLTQEDRRRMAVETARNRHHAIVTPLVQLYQGGQGFLVYVPIFSGTNFAGFIAGVFRAQDLFDAILTPDIAPDHAITLLNGTEIVWQRSPSPPPEEPQWVRSAAIALPGVAWRLLVWPTPALAAQLKSSLPLAVLVAGCLASGLLALMVFLAQTAFAKGRESAGVNRKLRQELEGRKKVELEIERLIAELEEAMTHIKTLSGLLPICASCKKIRDDKGYWSQIETYISRHSSASFTHGLCPDCAVKTLKEAGIETSTSSFLSAQPPDQA